MYVCVYIYIYICMCVCVYIYICVCVCVCIYICVCVCVCVCVWKGGGGVRRLLRHLARFKLCLGDNFFLVFNYRFSLEVHQIKRPPKIIAERARRNLIFFTCGSCKHSSVLAGRMRHGGRGGT
jgi:hypothetical protein